jgi:hypothetical protein
MTALKFVALPSETALAYQAGAVDANGQVPERHVCPGPVHPCRHCLTDIAEGDDFLILAHRPFPAPQPYAEVGPIFLHADSCPRHAGGEVPAMFLTRERLLVRGYGLDDRILYGTGRVVSSADLADVAADLLDRPEVAYLHLRSATDNCYHCRIERG